MIIVIEGPDGSGKTTVARIVVSELNKAGRKAVFTSEPTAESEYGKKLRQLLKNPSSNAAEMYELFVADRKEHLKWMKEQSAEGTYVICDRYKYSTFCYQGAHGMKPEEMTENNLLEPPDLTVILTATPEILMSRIEKRHNGKEIYETEQYLRKIVSLYENLNDFFDEKFSYVDAGMALEQVVKAVMDIININ